MKKIYSFIAKSIFGLFCFLLSYHSFSQHHTGSVSGKVKDGEYQDYLPGVRVHIPNTRFSTMTNDSGEYILKQIPHGHYQLIFETFGYTPDTVHVHIKSNHTLELNHEMGLDLKEMQAVEIIVEKRTSSETAVLDEVKNEDQVVSGISIQQIKKSQDRDAGQALQRIPGVTLMGGRFVMIRGLSERYNTVMINDAVSPSTSAERRSFSFDLIPTTLLDRMLVYKSGSAEIPGDFAGGVIKIYTRNAVDSNQVNVGLTTGYRTNTTFNSYYSSEASGTDFLGFDNGLRALPSDFPIDLENSSSADVEKFTKSLPNNFTTQEKVALPDLRLNIDWSRKFHIKDKEVGMVTAINYSNTYQTFKAERARYLDYEGDSSPKEWEFTDNTYSRNVRLGLLSNWLFRLNKNNKIEFKNMFNQLGENETIVREGRMIVQRGGDSLRNYSYRFASRTIYSGQLSGTHSFNSNRSEFHWVAGFSYFNSKTPDLRRFRTYKEIGTNDPYKIIIPPTATTFDAARFYSTLNEGTIMISGDFSHKLFHPDSTDEKGIELRAGYYVERKVRSFQARWMSYKYNSSNGQWADSVSALPIDQVFTPDHISYSSGFYLTEGTNPTDSYEAQNFLSAGYAGIVIPFKKLNIATGTRVEYNILSLQSQSGQGPIDIKNPVLTLLPFMNVSYHFSEKSLVRAAYSKTVNRPEFREIAPFLFHNFEEIADYVGSPDLKTANIHNADLRWEIYPSRGEMISIGGFYKRFNNPIETYIRQGTDNPIFTYGNANYAENIGVELEMRKSLAGFSEARFFKNLSLVFNGALIQSKVDLGSAAKAQDTLRALQGQSPYVVNGGLFYFDEDKKLMVSVLYNIFGRRIAVVGDKNNQTIYEMPRHSIDISISKEIKKNLEVKVGVQDLLNNQMRFIQDSNLDGKISEADEYVLKFKRGTYVTAGAGFRF